MDIWEIEQRNCNCGWCGDCKSAQRKFSKKHPIKNRIHDALDANNGRVLYYDLLGMVFPELVYPRAHNYSSNGGPAGCSMALSRAIDRYGFWMNPEREVSRLSTTDVRFTTPE